MTGAGFFLDAVLLLLLFVVSGTIVWRIVDITRRIKSGQKLYLSRNRIIAGVCSGIADFVGVSPIRIRVLFILGLGLGGLTFFIYLVLALTLPSR